jgi:hypothetical protein
MSDAYPVDNVASIDPELMSPALKKYGETLEKKTVDLEIKISSLRP